MTNNVLLEAPLNSQQFLTNTEPADACSSFTQPVQNASDNRVGGEIEVAQRSQEEALAGGGSSMLGVENAPGLMSIVVEGERQNNDKLAAVIRRLNSAASGGGGSQEVSTSTSRKSLRQHCYSLCSEIPDSVLFNRPGAL